MQPWVGTPKSNQVVEVKVRVSENQSSNNQASSKKKSEFMKMKNQTTRHHRQEVWEAIVSSPGVAISSANSHGMTALHTAARYLRSLDIFLDFSRFGVPEAVTLLLRQPGILVNSRTIQVKSLILGVDSCARARLLSWWEPSTAMLRL